MRKAFAVAAAGLVLALVPTPALAWGTAAHRFIMRRAIEMLPPEIKPFFVANADELVMRVTDPDLWRTVGWDDDSNHFVNFGASELGEFPFPALPREYGAALEKFGASALKRLGTLPWREEEESGNLRRAMEGFNRNQSFSIGNTVLFASVASHYLQDACQPLHASNNFDGQLTNQNGVHARFETALFERFQSRLAITPAPPTPIANARDAAFDVLLSSYRQVQPLLAADKAAIAGKDAYDDEYFEKFFAGVKPLLEHQLSAAVTATASMILGAWQQAGRPALKTEMPRITQKVRPPK
ncbi:MAG TPA: hypothetical protein VGJ29_14640 [Vicinamibacterales bacterium]|jgi:hypothetical protein